MITYIARHEGQSFRTTRANPVSYAVITSETDTLNSYRVILWAYSREEAKLLAHRYERAEYDNIRIIEVEETKPA
jgi:hypothetical protein